MNEFSAIAIRLDGQAWWVLSGPSCPEVLDPDDAAFPEIRPGLKGHDFVTTGEKLPPIVLEESSDGGRWIRLLETQHYDWGVKGVDDAIVTSSLEMLPGRQWSIRRMGMLSGSFAVVNHLGMAGFNLTTGGKEHRLALEIISAKLDYHTEFRQITEDIADFCQQVLLNWEAPTSLGFAVDQEHAARLMLEQFLFLRSHLQPDRLGEILASIQRRPNSRLVRDAKWTPSACAGSADWLRDPLGMARDWRRTAAGTRPLPAQVLDVRKEDSVDTAANRFVKFALTQFRDLCREVVEKHPSALSLAREACELGNALDAALSRPFFRELGSLTRLPLDNPTLQKRDAYREILRAWLLTQAAAALTWDRDEESYHGPTRNVATLYEYWIFLQLHQMLDEIPGVSRDLDNPKPADDAEQFLEMKNGEVVINLKRGKKTCAQFTVRLPTGMILKLHLYYERTFQMRSGATDAASYSRQFKPDYTRAIFPDRFPNEAKAAEAGKIAYVHFDAKYRAENLKMIFGELVKNDDELNEEKQEGKATSTYKRGEPTKYAGGKTQSPSAACILVYLKTKTHVICREKRLVYCRALKDDGKPIRIQIGNLAGAVLCPYSGARIDDKTSLPWLAPILSCEMMTLNSLCRILSNEGWPSNALPSTASAYLLFRLDEPMQVETRRITSLTPVGSYQAVSCTPGELDECKPTNTA